MRAAFTTLDQRAISLAMCAEKAAGVSPIGSRPFEASFARVSGMFNTFTISAFSFATMSLGVAAGAMRPFHVAA